MDRLLQGLFGTFIRRGTFKLTTSRGRTYTFGDGTGAPVAVRLASRHAELSLLRDPELKFGEAYMDGTLVVEQGSIPVSYLPLLFAQGVEAPKWALPRWLLRYISRRLTQFNPRKRPVATLHITTTSTAVSTPFSWMSTGSTAAPISKRRTPRSTMRNSPRNGISQRS